MRMERILLEISAGAVVAGGIFLGYVRRVKKKLRLRILRDLTSKKT